MNAEDYSSLRDLLGLAVQEEQLAQPVQPVTTTIRTSLLGYRPISVTVSWLGGESHQFNLLPSTTVLDFKKAIQDQFGVAVNLQLLSFKGTELKAYINEHTAHLHNYNITEGSSIQLIRRLLAISNASPLRNISFVVKWGWPQRDGKRAFLDATCFVYTGRTLLTAVDYRTKDVVAGMSHSGAKMQNSTRRGQHVISISLPALGSDITHIFFTMSACHLPNIGSFLDPAIELYDKAHPTKQLCPAAVIGNNGDSKAVVVCCLKRVEGGWDYIELSTRTNGFVYNYKPIEHAIQNLFRVHGLETSTVSM